MPVKTRKNSEISRIITKWGTKHKFIIKNCYFNIKNNNFSYCSVAFVIPFYVINCAVQRTCEPQRVAVGRPCRYRFSCLYLTVCDCSPSCFDPDLLLLAYLWPGLSWIGCISTIKHFPHQKQAAGTLHQQQAAGEAQQTHSVEITIKRSGSKRQTVSAYRQQHRAVNPVRRDLSYISKKGEYGHKEGGHRREDSA